jgi:uncharacterized ferritin-like protein (DUF455 family)
MQFFRTLENLLTTAEPSEKIAAFRSFYKAYKAGKVVFEPAYEPRFFEEPSYKGICRIVSPLAVPKRKNLNTDQGKIFLLHAIAHIEYSAIDLALDHAYRFGGMPKAYYDDWLAVADDEVRHFEMIEGLLEELGSRYGAVEVHDALFEASQKTQGLLERMAVVPRYLEANGLDATPEILQKLQKMPPDAMTEKIMAALRLILDEEVDHVFKGDRWFAYACELEGVDKSAYFDIIEKYYPDSFPRKKSINAEARQEAGFSCSELNAISRARVC